MLKQQKKARRLFDRLTKRLRIELFRSGAFKVLKQKKFRPWDGIYKIFIEPGLQFNMHVIGRHVFVNSVVAKS